MSCGVEVSLLLISDDSSVGDKTLISTVRTKSGYCLMVIVSRGWYNSDLFSLKLFVTLQSMGHLLENDSLSVCDC